MTRKMHLEQILLILAIIFLPINHFRIDIPFIGTALSKFFILVGIALYILKLCIGKLKLTRFERFAFFYLFVSLSWQCLCTVIGIHEFDYYSLVSLDQMDKLRYFIQMLQNNGLPITDISAIKVWLCLRFLKDCLLYVVFSYGVSLWVYQLYRDKDTYPEGSRSVAFSHLTLSITVLCLVMTAYSIIEIGYLTGNMTCARILAQINPLLYEVKRLHGWWPPLLWKNQLRSLFAEPSFFGLASTMIVPILIYKILDSSKYTFKRFFACVFGIFIVMLFLTRARTALLLFVGQLFLLVSYVLFFKRVYLKKVIHILFVILLSFVVSLFIMSSFKVVNLDSGTAYTSNVQVNAADYINDNIASVVGNKRSNSARFASVRATFLTGFQHPLFGVGRGLSTAYVNANFTEEDLRNNEVRNWSRYVEQEGVLKSPIPVLNQFSIVFANFGIVGLVLYLLPMFYALVGILNRLYSGLMDIEGACLTIAYIATIVAMLSNVAFLTYYIMTGILISYIRISDGRSNSYEHQ